MAASAVQASSTVSANTETQSSVRQAGTTPKVETRPRLGLSPTILLKPAGTRPEPAVSVPSASGTRPAADRDGRAGARSARNEIGIEWVARHAIGRTHADQAGGELIEIGLADDDGAGRAQPRHRGRILRRVIAKAGQAAVVGRPATSILSFTATGTP